jgi:hypothetical protein
MPGIKPPNVYYKDLEEAKKYCDSDLLQSQKIETIILCHKLTNNNLDLVFKKLFKLFKKTKDFLGDYVPNKVFITPNMSYNQYIKTQHIVDNFEYFMMNSFNGGMIVFDDESYDVDWYDKEDYKNQIKIIKTIMGYCNYRFIMAETFNLSTRPFYSFSVIKSDYIKNPVNSVFIKTIFGRDRPDLTFVFVKKIDRDNALTYIMPPETKITTDIEEAAEIIADTLLCPWEAIKLKIQLSRPGF